LILKYRNLSKLKGTYIDNIQNLVDDELFLHCSYNQNVTTGRMSSSEPNLQNIPARNKAIRKAFIVPNSDYVFVFIDYSQVELRLTADRSQDPTLLDCYPFQGKGQDVHTLTLADVVLNQPLSVVQAMKVNKNGHIDKPQRGESCQCQACLYDFYRNIAKRVNFGIIYGAGPEAIQRQVSTPTRLVSKDECEEYIRKYFERYPGVKEWIMMSQAFMKRHGYVQNSFGRYRRLEVKHGMKKWQIERLCRQGVNFLIQGEAADLFKTAAVRVSQIFQREKCKTRLVNFVHDELQFYWHKSELHLLKEVKKVMEDFSYRVPIVAEISYSPTDWSTKKELKMAA
jgi:DNA polymerase-1